MTIRRASTLLIPRILFSSVATVFARVQVSKRPEFRLWDVIKVIFKREANYN